jgi:hypothetical protein
MREADEEEHLSALEGQMVQLRGGMETLTAHSLRHRADIETLLGALAAAGLTHVDAIPLEKWFAEESKRRLYLMMKAMEDKNPGLAAHLQAILDREE